MKNPEWFEAQHSHKAVYVGPGALPVPLCKIQFREFWPNDGCFDSADISRYSPWSHAVKALGNSVVPAQAREAFERLMGLKDS